MCFAGFTPDPRSGIDRAFDVGLIHQILLKSSPPRTSSTAGGGDAFEAIDELDVNVVSGRVCGTIRPLESLRELVLPKSL
ncbi:hypothetical protein Q3G72_003725 [Acer saccharum]|nr:hypothetical protein Q3G72_003725 [Acer saccharum]